MNYFRKIVKNHDYIKIKKYIQNAFKYRKGVKKDGKFYKSICILYSEYPETVKKILDNIPKWGYYKDYLYFLYYIDYLCKKITGYSYIRKVEGKYIDVDPEEYQIQYNNYRTTLNDKLNNTSDNINGVINMDPEENKNTYIHNFMSNKLKYNKNYKIKTIYEKKLHISGQLEGMKMYIYNILVNQLKNDFIEYRKGNQISTLAKWLPRMNHMFVKTIKDFLPIFVGMYYNININDNNNINNVIKHNRYKNYNNLIVTLSKYMNVAELYIKSNQLDKIDFNTISFKCLISNKNTFIKNPICEQNYGKCIYTKFKDASIVYIINVIIKYNVVAIEKQMFNKIFMENLEKYQQEIIKLINIDFTKYDMLLDLSKKIHDSKNMDIAIAIAIILNSMNMNIIINGKRCHIKKFTDNFCNNVNILVFSMIDFSILNIQDAQKFTNKQLLILGDYDKIKNNHTTDINNVYLIPNKYINFKQKHNNLYIGNILYKKVIKTNKRDFMKILHNSIELNSEHITPIMLLTRFSILVLFFVIFVNCILFFTNITKNTNIQILQIFVNCILFFMQFIN